MQFVGRVQYDYPCDGGELTVSVQTSVDIEGLNMPSVDADLTIFCPASAGRVAGKAFDLIVSLPEKASVAIKVGRCRLTPG